MSDERFQYVKAPGALDIPKLRADGLYPTDERVAQGPVAVFECGQRIPCNPCETACKQGCVTIGDDITAMPRVDERCTGCGMCLPVCPGLCVFILNGAYSETQATVTMPYELQPLPRPGERVDALDREGAKVCDGEIVAVRKLRKTDPCYALTVAIPKRYVHDVRHVRSRRP